MPDKKPSHPDPTWTPERRLNCLRDKHEFLSFAVDAGPTSGVRNQYEINIRLLSLINGLIQEIELLGGSREDEKGDSDDA